MENIVEDFCRFTEELLLAKKTYGTLHTFSTKDCWSLVHQMEEVYNEILDHKNYYKGGQRVKFGTWLIDSMFPRPLYESAGGSLIKLLEDKRFFHPPSSLSKKGNFHNFFGRMARPRKVPGSKYVGFLDYMLDRWSRDNHKSMPHYYFSIEEPEWAFGELMKNTEQIKSGRTSVSCVMNICFRWDNAEKRIIMSTIMKHTQWNHTFEDYCGSALILYSIAKELGLDPDKGVVNIFLPSATMDYPKEAKYIVCRMREKILGIESDEEVEKPTYDIKVKRIKV